MLIQVMQRSVIPVDIAAASTKLSTQFLRRVIWIVRVIEVQEREERSIHTLLPIQKILCDPGRTLGQVPRTQIAGERQIPPQRATGHGAADGLANRDPEILITDEAAIESRLA